MPSSIRTKIVASFLVAMTTIVVASIVFGLVLARMNENRIADEVGLKAAQQCATMFEFMADNESIDSIEDIDPNSEEYAQYRDFLRSICQDAGMDYMYAIKYDYERSTITYLMCVADDDIKDSSIAQERSFGTVVPVEFSEQELRTLQGETVEEPLVIDNQFGFELAWFSKVENWDNVLAVTEYSVSEQRWEIVKSVAEVIIPIVLALVILLLVQLHVLGKNVFEPIHTISDRMRTFSTDRAHTFEPLNIESNDEMGEIAEAFNEMATDINTYLGDIERMTEERVQADVELNVARRIQLGIVPPLMDRVGDGFEACAFAKPARMVGGDFYDCIELDDGHIALVVGDVSGKGIAAALFMALAKVHIAEQLTEGTRPADVLNHVNEQLCKTNPEGMFATVFVAVLDPTTGHVRFANAGHLPPFVIGENTRRMEIDPGVMLGLFEDSDIEEGEFELKEGESLLLFTDGVTEAVNAEHEFFGDVRLEQHLQAHAPYAHAQKVVDIVAEHVAEFAAGCEQFDDLTIVCIERTSARKQALPVSMDALAIMHAEVLAHAPNPARGRQACLACEEALVNIVSYSQANHIWLTVSSEGEGDEDVALRIVLEDDGTPFNPMAVNPVEKDFEDLDTGGMGINLIRELATELTYHREGPCNVLTIIM